MPTRIPTQIPRVQRSKLAQEIARLKRELTMLTDDPDYAGKNEQIAEARRRVRSLKDKSTQLMDELSAIDKESEKQQARPPPPPPPPPPTLRTLSPHPILSIPSQHPPLVPFSHPLTLSLPLSPSLSLSLPLPASPPSLSLSLSLSVALSFCLSLFGVPSIHRIPHLASESLPTFSRRTTTASRPMPPKRRPSWTRRWPRM